MTGEAPTFLPALPDPGTSSLAAVTAACRMVYDLRSQLIGGLPLDVADELRRRASAIEGYLRGIEGSDDAQRAARVLEAAVGEALGEPDPGDNRPGVPLATDKGTSQQLRHEFRLMARSRDAWMPLLEEGGLSRAAALRLSKGDAPGTAHVSANSGESEWYTPAGYIAAARAVMGGIDLDPASNATANAVVGATEFYTAAQDGLSLPWSGRVWMNPPYSQPLVALFASRLADELAMGSVTEACALMNNATETEWFQSLAGASTAMCFPNGRIRYWHPERAGAPLQGQCVLYMGANVGDFHDAFGPFGFTVQRP